MHFRQEPNLRIEKHRDLSEDAKLLNHNFPLSNATKHYLEQHDHNSFQGNLNSNSKNKNSKNTNSNHLFTLNPINLSDNQVYN